MQVGQQILEKRTKKSELHDDELDLLAVYTKSTNRTTISIDELSHIDALKEVNKVLGNFRLNKNEIRVYLYLARFGAHKAQTIAETLGIQRTEGYKILKRLESQGLVSKIMERPMKFVAAPLESVLNNLIEERRQKIHEMEKKKAQLLKLWTALPEPESVSHEKEKIQVLEGANHICVRLSELLENSKTTFEIVVSDSNLIWLYNTPFLDEVGDKIKNENLSMKMMTPYSPTSNYVMDQIEIGNGDFTYMKGEKIPGFFMNDSGEMILLMTNDKNTLYGMWTNYKSIVQSYRILFDLLYQENVSN